MTVTVDPVAHLVGSDVTRSDAVVAVFGMAAAALPARYRDALADIAREYTYCAAFVDAAALCESSTARYLDRNAEHYAAGAASPTYDDLTRADFAGRARAYRDAGRVLELAAEAAERAVVRHDEVTR
jgi:hypothetical protein